MFAIEQQSTIGKPPPPKGAHHDDDDDLVFPPRCAGVQKEAEGGKKEKIYFCAKSLSQKGCHNSTLAPHYACFLTSLSVFLARTLAAVSREEVATDLSLELTRWWTMSRLTSRILGDEQRE